MVKSRPCFIALAVSAALSSVSFSAIAEEEQINQTNTDMEVIVISGSKTEQKLGDVAGSISVMTEHDMEKQVVTDMRDLFKYEPGVTVTGSAGEAQNIIVRGMGGDRVLMIKDGMRMNEGYGADGKNDVVGRGFIDTDTLKQVEVSKSAASSLYGSDAMGGVVVFTTKDPSDLLKGDDTYFKVKSGYQGTSNQASIGLTAANKFGDYEHMVSATYRDGEETQNYAGDKDERDIESVSLFYKGVYHLTSNDTLKFTADVWQQDTDAEFAYGLAEYFRDLDDYGYLITDENSTGEKENTSFKLSYHSERTNSWYDSLNMAIYRNKADQDDEEYVRLDIDAPMFGQFGIRDMWSRKNYQQTTIGFLSNGLKAIELDSTVHTLGFGLDVETTNSERTEHNYRIQNDEVILDEHSEKFPENDTLRIGVFVNDAIAFGQWTVTPGMRFDYYDMDPENSTAEGATQYESIDDNQLSPSLGAVYKFNPRLSAYGQYAKGFKVPPYDLAYIEHDNSIYGYKIIPTDNLDSESSDSFELGLRGHIDNFAFTTAIFYNKYDDFININLVGTEEAGGGFMGTDPVLVYQYENIDSVTIKGAEAGVTYYLADSWSLYVNAAYQDGEDDDSGDYIPTISPISGVAGIAYDSDNWGVDTAMRWAKEMTKVNEGEYQTSGYGVVDVIGYYQIGENLKVNARIENLFDKEYVQHQSVAGFEQDADINPFTEPGREFSATISYEF